MSHVRRAHKPLSATVFDEVCKVIARCNCQFRIPGNRFSDRRIVDDETGLVATFYNGEVPHHCYAEVRSSNASGNIIGPCLARYHGTPIDVPARVVGFLTQRRMEEAGWRSDTLLAYSQDHRTIA